MPIVDIIYITRQWERGMAMDYLGLVLIMLLGLLAGGLVFYLASRYAFNSAEVKLVIGVRNQEAYVEGVVRGLFALAYKKLPDFFLLVIDLGSTDQTPVILSKLCQQYPGMIYVDRTTYSGKTSFEEIALMNCGGGGVYYLDWTEEVNHRQIIPAVNKLLFKLNSSRTSVESIVADGLCIKQLEWSAIGKNAKNRTKVLEK
ncbi:MAG: glycosyltransferase [Clostridia bacterium]|nr:glycosyltransferase [Clostridia bacterium]